MWYGFLNWLTSLNTVVSCELVLTSCFYMAESYQAFYIAQTFPFEGEQGTQGEPILSFRFPYDIIPVILETLKGRRCLVFGDDPP